MYFILYCILYFIYHRLNKQFCIIYSKLKQLTFSFVSNFPPAIANVATQTECCVETEQIAAIWYGRPIYRAGVKVANVANVGWSCQPVQTFFVCHEYLRKSAQLGLKWLIVFIHMILASGPHAEICIYQLCIRTTGGICTLTDQYQSFRSWL